MVIQGDVESYSMQTRSRIHTVIVSELNVGNGELEVTTLASPTTLTTVPQLAVDLGKQSTEIHCLPKKGIQFTP